MQNGRRIIYPVRFPTVSLFERTKRQAKLIRISLAEQIRRYIEAGVERDEADRRRDQQMKRELNP